MPIERKLLSDEEKYQKILAKAEIFWSRIDKRGPDDCWPWLGAIDVWGYGFINIKPTLMKSHRAVWILTHGMITSEEHVLHRCDNPPCCNERHLFLGDNDMNVADMVTKGRQSKGEKNSAAVKAAYQALFEKNPELYLRKVGAKLCYDDVRLIRERDGTLKEIAAEFGICEETVRKIRKGKIWRHVA